MQAGKTVLIQAGASGLGMAAIQMAKAFGATVMTTVGSQEKAVFVRALGADIIVNRKTDDLGAVMDKYPVDIALDCVVGPDMGRYVTKMARGGRWIVIATLAGARTEIDMNVFFRKGLKVIGSTLRSRTSAMKAQIMAALEDRLWDKFASKGIKPVIDTILPMCRAEEAHEILAQQRNRGKVVLTLK